MCGLCQRGVARGAYTRSNSQGAFDANRRAWCSGTRCALWTIDLLVDANDGDLRSAGSGLAARVRCA